MASSFVEPRTPVHLCQGVSVALLYARRDLLSSTARAKQVMMNAVNDRDSPVFALWSLR